VFSGRAGLIRKGSKGVETDPAFFDASNFACGRIPALRMGARERQDTTEVV
jgi:hypothetical protein